MKDKAATEFQDMLAALRMLGADPVPPPRRPDPAALRRLERENALLIDHAEMLACALGACPNCWGMIPDCEDCGGIGKPGAFDPDRICFDHFVLPVITRVLGRAEGLPQRP